MQGRRAFEGGEKIDMDEDVDADVGEDIDEDVGEDVDEDVGESVDEDVDEDMDMDADVGEDVDVDEDMDMREDADVGEDIDVDEDVAGDVAEGFVEDVVENVDEDVHVDMDVDKFAQISPSSSPPLFSLSSPLNPSSASSPRMRFSLPTSTSTTELLSSPNPPRCARRGRPRLARRGTWAAITWRKVVCPVFLRTSVFLSSKSRGALLRE